MGSGTYAGSKTVLSEEIDATIVVHDDGTLDLKISGVIAIDCDAEKYTYADGTIALTDLDPAGDCAHDALADNHVTFKSSTYDASADSITITVKYALFVSNAFALADAAPSGTYAGSKTVLGEEIDAT